MKRTKFSNSVPVLSLEQYCQLLSEEWNKPKARKIKRRYDTREVRSYKKIKELKKQIANTKKYERIQIS